jgi:carbon-monoxide dehydrogenase large subunit
MEPRAAIGDYDPARAHFTLYTTSQNPHVAGWCSAAFIGIARSTSCASWHPMSAAASARRSSSTPRRASAVWAAKKVGRPVKWTADRTEAFLSDAHGRDHVTQAELGFDATARSSA